MVLQKFNVLKVKEGRETVFIKEIGYPKGQFKEDVRRYANGLLNSHGGVIYFGVNSCGQVLGSRISRKDEDDYRLAVDHAFGSFQPFVTASHYRLSFLEVKDGSRTNTIIELKVSVGEIGEIYEDGCLKVYLVDAGSLIGPLYPQELKELILLKYKESLEGAEQAARFATPNLAVAREKAKKKSEADKLRINRGLEKIIEDEDESKRSPLKSKVSSQVVKPVPLIKGRNPIKYTCDFF